MKIQTYSLLHVSDIHLPPALLSSGGTLESLTIRERILGALFRFVIGGVHVTLNDTLIIFFLSLLSLYLGLNLGLCARQAKSLPLSYTPAWQPFPISDDEHSKAFCLGGLCFFIISLTPDHCLLNQRCYH